MVLDYVTLHGINLGRVLRCTLSGARYSFSVGGTALIWVALQGCSLSRCGIQLGCVAEILCRDLHASRESNPNL